MSNENTTSYKVFINPGHCPGIDPGAINHEKHLVEAEISREIGGLLTQKLRDLGFEVDCEQSDNICGEDGYDYAGSVCYHANKWQANAFISLHCNSFGSCSACGTEVYFHPDSVNGKRLAQLIQKKIVATCGTTERHPNPEVGRNFMVCKHTAMPAVLVELAFLSNPEDAEKLVAKKDSFASSIAEAVVEYFK